MECRNGEKQFKPRRPSGFPIPGAPENGVDKSSGNRTENWHWCPWLKRLRRDRTIHSRELGKFAPKLREKGCQP